MGAALVAMVAELTIGRSDAAEHQPQILALRDAALARQSALLDLAEEDATAYAAVVVARRMPKGDEREREARARILRTSMVTAAEVPLRTAQVAAEVLDMAHTIAPIGNPNAVSDAGVAAQLAGAAVGGALLNVRINLPYLPAGEPLLESAPPEMERLQAAADAAERAALEVVARRIGRS
jgi:formiminotetrahydrofolate cyclodeaminase